ncbi:hypothetical protein MVEG_07296 [Podila verticillata NRRL 6337]|nr:hypothetical protein MVEG_07296 [Podila verticillata NRRL 6337]
MDGQSDESAAELADRYREKVEARRRGAGTHQSRFRGFTLTGADNPPQKPIASTPSGTINRATRASVSRKSEVDVTELEQEEETTTITKTLSSLTVTSEASSAHRPVTRSLVGLNDRYKERVNARIRGAGVHQSDFRGFTIKPTKADKPKVDQAKEALVEIRDREPSRRASSRRQTTLQLRGPETSIPEITDTISRNDTSKPRPSVTSGSSDEAPVKKAPNVRPRPKARSAKTPSKVNEQPGPEKSRQEQNRAEDDFFRKTTAPVQTPSATKTRSSSRQSGESPTFRISWGKNDTTVITDSHGDGTRSSTVHNSPKRRFDQDEILDDHSADMDMDQDFGDSYVNDDGPSSDSDLQDPIPDATNIQALPLTKDQSNTQAQAPVKRRRLIQEEVDENDNPHMDPEFSTKPTSRSKKIVESLADPKSMAKPAAKSAAKERTTLVESDRNTLESTKKTSKKAAVTKAQPGVRKELKQATLLQLVAKPKKKPTQDGSLGSTTPLPDDQNYTDLSDFEDDFQKSNVRTKTSATLGLEKPKSKSLPSSSKSHKAKGSADKNVKVYKQLQIQCLKFLGPSTSVSKPATVRNPEIAKQLPVPGETPVNNNNNEEEAPKKLVQGVLEIEQAPLSEMDVIAEAVRDVIDNFIDGLEDQALAKDMLILRSDLETLLIEQVDLLDDHALLKASVKKAEGVKKELRVRLLETQRRRHKVREKLARVRSKFEREDRARRRLEDTHKFLTDLEALRDQAVGVEEEEEEPGQSDRTVKTGLQSFIATVGARSCGGGDKDSERPPQPGALGTLKDFNRLLESLTS